ncbi:MAG: Imidazole glycerol phosphate synthase subunit HisH 1 [Alphaproteobacteria bacterium ADurb.Bin438]|nr:MAG: Imidazole glycerol phosphate synthase subunit HisH 1 [Alphaproteobacteria bacterium ADurb.Bin438]
MKKIAIIDYGAGNLRSVHKSFLKVSNNKHEIIVTSNYHHVLNADYVVLPGVGAFGDCMNGVLALNGMADTIKEVVLNQKKPFMGICVGMQLLAEKGFEYGEHKGFGFFKGNITKIDGKGLKIPHMGWNELNLNFEHEVFSSVESGKSHVYFVHSYHLTDFDEKEVIATTDYGNQKIVAAVLKDNIIGLQFHPEKSQEVGLNIIKNFINWG